MNRFWLIVIVVLPAFTMTGEAVDRMWYRTTSVGATQGCTCLPCLLNMFYCIACDASAAVLACTWASTSFWRYNGVGVWLLRAKVSVDKKPKNKIYDPDYAGGY